MVERPTDEGRQEERERPPTVVRADSSADEALEVQTLVVEENGRWAVEIVVVFADGVVRRRIDTHHTKRRAEISAALIKRAAERNIGGPING
ncbi:hypothetical protein ACX9NE_18075 [Mycobacterium sp. ML4]